MGLLDKFKKKTKINTSHNTAVFTTKNVMINDKDATVTINRDLLLILVIVNKLKEPGSIWARPVTQIKVSENFTYLMVAIKQHLQYVSLKGLL